MKGSIAQAHVTAQTEEDLAKVEAEALVRAKQQNRTCCLLQKGYYVQVKQEPWYRRRLRILQLKRWNNVTGAPYREMNSKVATAPKLKVEDKGRVNNSQGIKRVKLNIIKLKA